MKLKTYIIIGSALGAGYLILKGGNAMASAISIPGVPDNIKNLIVKYANKYNVPLSFAFALFKIESNFNPEAYNSSDPGGAYGVGQMTARTAVDLIPEMRNKGLINVLDIPRDYNNVINREEYRRVLKDNDNNINMCLYLFSKYMDRNDFEVSYVRYNAGPGKTGGGFKDRAWIASQPSSTVAMQNLNNARNKFAQIKQYIG